MAFPHPPIALHGLRVLDLTRVRAGPTCTRVLADFGADVIKIEPPEGVDPNEGMSGARDGYDMLNLHRNKRSMTLNLKEPAGLQVFLKLAATADIVVENYRPDVKERLGFDYETLAMINPRIILASVSGFGQTGPYANLPGFDQIAQGMGGLMGITGRPGEGPMRAGNAPADSSAGLYAAIGILVALQERQRSGVGQWVHTSLLEAQIAMNDFQAARYLIDGAVPPQAGNDHPYVTPMGVLATADGHINIGVAGEGQWQAFCRVIGAPELIAHPDFANMNLRFKNRPQLAKALEPFMAKRSSAEWIALFNASSVPTGPIYRMDEVFADPHIAASGITQTVSHPTRGDIRVIAQPVTLSRTPAQVVSSLPDKGAHTAEILAEIGISGDAAAALAAAGAV
jgi:crotonobetainyl-CoA:carnitine CoA-transferase CaiB-like acyl-CoA transferase